MAFNRDNLFCTSGTSGDAPRVYSYGTTDSLETVLASGYFNDAFRLLRANDIIQVVANGDMKQLKIVSSNSALVDSTIASSSAPRYRKYVRQAADFDSPIRSDIEYFIDGVVDMGSTSIEVPAGGIYLHGYNFDVSQLTSTENNYTMFTSPAGGSGNVLWHDLGVSVSGTSSQVFNLVSDTGNEALELNRINFNSCTSLGEIDNYRQILEVGNGRFGGTPEITLKNAMNGYRVTETIVRGLSNISALFKAGSGLAFSGRFITDINCDLPATGALLDFAPANFSNNESLLIQGAFITRSGVIDASDTTIYPNIDHEDVQSNWVGNTGLPNTSKYIKTNCSAEVVTTVSLANTYYTLAGTQTVEKSVHFDMPANGELRALSGSGDYHVSGDIILVGTANDEIDIRVTKSTDGGSTWPTEVNHMKRQINNIVGARDVAFYPLSFIVTLNKNDRIRLEVENKTAARNVTMEIDSYFIVSEV